MSSVIHYGVFVVVTDFKDTVTFAVVPLQQISIHGVPPHLFLLVLEYMYTGSLNTEISPELACDLLQVANMYTLTDLTRMAQVQRVCCGRGGFVLCRVLRIFDTGPTLCPTRLLTRGTCRHVCGRALSAARCAWSVLCANAWCCCRAGPGSSHALRGRRQRGVAVQVR
jgi:hypothetical protein